MRNSLKYRVVYPWAPHSTSTPAHEEVEAYSMGFKDGALVFYGEDGYITAAFQTWVRIDRVIG